MKIQDFLIESTQSDHALQLLKQATKGTEWENRLFIAGGFVRDTILGRESKDIDFVVKGGPDAGLKAATFIAQKLGIYKEGSNPVIFPTYFTAKLSIPTSAGHMDIEFVAPRKEKYTPGSRKPAVSAGTIKDDVMRRDFTINSLIQNLHTGKILDLSKRGINDLHRHVLDTTGDPDVIFGEDPLRILRAVRFAIKYNLHITPRTLDGIKKFAIHIKDISTERINDEINKILKLQKPSRAFELFKQTGLLAEVLPELQQLVDLKQNAYHNKDAWGHTMDVLDASSPVLINRLAALFHDVGKVSTRTEVNGKVQFIGHETVGATVARNVLHRLKYPNDVIDQVVTIIAHHMALKSAGPDASNLKDSTLRKLIFKVGNQLEPLLDVMHADNLSHTPEKAMPLQIDKIRQRIQTLDVNSILKTQSILNGNEIRELGAEGPLIGQIKERLLLKALENPEFSRQQATNLVQNMIQASKRTGIKK